MLFLKKLKGVNTDKIKEQLEKARDGDIHTICQCALNICKKRISVKPETVSKLTPYKGVIKNIALKQSKVERKRYFSAQKGGFSPLLASIIAFYMFKLMNN